MQLESPGPVADPSRTTAEDVMCLELEEWTFAATRIASIKHVEGVVNICE